MCKFADVKKFKIVNLSWNLFFYIKYVAFFFLAKICSFLINCCCFSIKKLLFLVVLTYAMLHMLDKPK